METERLETCETCSGEGYIAKKALSEDEHVDDDVIESEMQTCPTYGGAGSVVIREP